MVTAPPEVSTRVNAVLGPKVALTAVLVLEAAVKKAGSLDQEALRKVLTELKMDTVMGKHEVDPATGMQIGVKGLLVNLVVRRVKKMVPA